MVATTNIFMNPYEQPENKLTYNFLCLIEHIENMENQKAFCEFLIDKKFELSESAVIKVKPQPSDKKSSIPDGKILLRTNNDKEFRLFFENKTHRMQLDIEQLERHLENYCQDENTFLLVITPRSSDKGIIDSLNKQYDNKILFKTWDHVAEKLERLPSFMTRQFVEYGKISGEFENINEISSTDIDYYCRNFSDLQSDGIFLKIRKLIERLAEDDINFAQYGLKDVNPERHNRWGRRGLDFSFNTGNNYVRWFFYGIYYNTEDHQIPFREEGVVPELAFFFDVHPPVKVKKQLRKKEHFKRALGNLEKLGFEKNLTTTNGNKKWRLLFKRVPLNDKDLKENFSYQEVKKRFEEILSQLRNEEAFYQEMMAPPE